MTKARDLSKGVFGADVTVPSEGGAVNIGVQQGSLKAWLNYKHKSTVSVRDSHNITSVTDVATGYAEVNFNNNFNNSNHSPVIMGDGDSSSHHTSACTRSTTTGGNATFNTGTHEYYMHNIGGSTLDAFYVTAHYAGDLA